MPEVSIVIVCMNRPDILFPCLDSIKAHTGVSYETLVVAYMFSADNLARLKDAYPWVTVIESNELRGFAENNNLALQQARGRYCFVVNDDTLMNESVIDSLVLTFETLPVNAAALSPCIRFPDGRIQTCGRTPWTAWRYAKHYLHLVHEGNTEEALSPEPSGAPPLRPSHKDLRARRTQASVCPPNPCGPLPLTRPRVAMGSGESASSVLQTYTLNGACFLIRTDVFRKAGWFDQRYFFTPEDIALGHKLNDMGYTVWANPSVSITHIAGGSVSAMEQAIKPARVRGSMIFYGERLWLKCFVWCVEAGRIVKHTLFPGAKSELHKTVAGNVMKAVFSHESPKEIFKRFKP